MKVNHKAIIAERKQILDLIEWIVDGIFDVEYPDGYQFLNVSYDTFEYDPERLKAWNALTNSKNRSFVHQCLYDLNIGIEGGINGIHIEETVFYAKK